MLYIFVSYKQVHLLHKHLKHFAENCGRESDEQGERFHQTMMRIEERYKSQGDDGLLSDTIWSQLKVNPETFKRH